MPLSAGGTPRVQQGLNSGQGTLHLPKLMVVDVTAVSWERCRVCRVTIARQHNSRRQVRLRLWFRLGIRAYVEVRGQIGSGQSRRSDVRRERVAFGCTPAHHSMSVSRWGSHEATSDSRSAQLSIANRAEDRLGLSVLMRLLSPRALNMLMEPEGAAVIPHDQPVSRFVLARNGSARASWLRSRRSQVL